MSSFIAAVVKFCSSSSKEDANPPIDKNHEITRAKRISSDTITRTGFADTGLEVIKV